MITIDDTVRGRDSGRLGRVVRWWIPGRVAIVAWCRGPQQKVGVGNLELVERAPALSDDPSPTAAEFKSELEHRIGGAA